MIKELGLATVITAGLLLSGCGGSGGGSKTDSLNDKRYIVILTEAQTGICESSDYRNSPFKFGGLITKETANNTSCETYGKKNDGNECAIELVGGGDRNCVLGFDTFEGQGKQAKVANNSVLYNISEILSNEF